MYSIIRWYVCECMQNVWCMPYAFKIRYILVHVCDILIEVRYITLFHVVSNVCSFLTGRFSVSSPLQCANHHVGPSQCCRPIWWSRYWIAWWKNMQGLHSLESVKIQHQILIQLYVNYNNIEFPVILILIVFS